MLVATVPVDPGHDPYDILIGAGLLADAAAWTGLPAAAHAVIVSNVTVAPLYAKAVRDALRPHYGRVSAVVLPDGEAQMPRVNSGIRLAPITALLAASAAATPSSLPLPNASGVLEARMAAP
jgi:3-dehydroquinate synthetase